MEPYMETLRQVPLLREDEEQALARQFQAGDEALGRPCPQCKAKRGQRCTNYKGKACAPHSDRNRGGEADV